MKRIIVNHNTPLRVGFALFCAIIGVGIGLWFGDVDGIIGLIGGGLIGIFATKTDSKLKIEDVYEKEEKEKENISI